MAESKEQRLWRGCTDGDLEAVRELANDPAVDVNWVGDDRGDIPLHRACRFGWLEIVKVLLAQERIEVNKGNKGDASPCYISGQEGHKEVVSRLLADPRIDPSKPNINEATPFYIACQNGHKEVVSPLLADPRIDPNKPNKNETTPFNVACQNGHKEVVSLLLADPRIDPNKPKNDQSTPLWYASQNGHLEVVQHLLASGREIDTKMKSTYNNKTAAEHAWAMGAADKDDDETEEDYERGKANGPLCADLIDAYEKDPAKVRSQLRKQLGLPGNPSPSSSFS